jgi:hypothetical protein
VNAHSEPDAVFKVNPTRGADGVVRGQSPFDVTFNMCQSRDPDPGDELRFTYDFDGDGTVDARGPCRATNTYRAPRATERCRQAITCVSDRQPDHSVCRTWEVCVSGAANGLEVTGFRWQPEDFVCPIGAAGLPFTAGWTFTAINDGPDPVVVEGMTATVTCTPSGPLFSCPFPSVDIALDDSEIQPTTPLPPHSRSTITVSLEAACANPGGASGAFVEFEAKNVTVRTSAGDLAARPENTFRLRQQ